jgi:hypothetical protein
MRKQTYRHDKKGGAVASDAGRLVRLMVLRVYIRIRLLASLTGLSILLDFQGDNRGNVYLFLYSWFIQLLDS